VPKVGLTGLNLGGYTTALLAGLEPRLEFALPVVPIVSIPDAMMEWKPLDRLMTGIMTIAGHEDRMASPRHTVALQRHWHGCQAHWLNGQLRGHSI